MSIKSSEETLAEMAAAYGAAMVEQTILQSHVGASKSRDDAFVAAGDLLSSIDVHELLTGLGRVWYGPGSYGDVNAARQLSALLRAQMDNLRHVDALLDRIIGRSDQPVARGNGTVSEGSEVAGTERDSRIPK